MKKTKLFFTLNNFTHWSGGSLRIKGLLNTLALEGQRVELYSNIKDESILNENIIHHQINITFSQNEKRLFQLLVALFPLLIVDIIFFKKLKKLKLFFLKNNFKNQDVIFFEFLDNSLAYYLKKKSLIGSYTNDIHGMAPNEFKNKVSLSLIAILFNKLRYYISIRLDDKVFNYANGLIFASQTMKNYYLNLYKSIADKKIYIIPYVLESRAFEQTVNLELYKKIRQKYSLAEDSKVIFYAGGFKEIGGILDLIDAFILLKKHRPNTILFILGKGNAQNNIDKRILQHNLQENIILAGTIPYEQLRTYQEIADVIVCPDKKNIFSDLIIHLKYYDSLLSGKVILNGSFSSVLEINSEDKLSISFEPSNIDDLASKIMYVLDNQDRLNKKYMNNKDLTFFQYSHYYEEMLKLYK